MLLSCKADCVLSNCQIARRHKNRYPFIRWFLEEYSSRFSVAVFELYTHAIIYDVDSVFQGDKEKLHFVLKWYLDNYASMEA